MSEDVQHLKASELRHQLADLHSECWGWALACCRGNARTAEEVLQMSYQKILNGSARFAGRSSFKTWLLGVVRLTALDERRWSVRHWLRFLPLPDQETWSSQSDTNDAPIVTAERHQTVRVAVASLSARQAEVLHLVFYHDMTLDEAALVMRVSPGTARTHYERSKAALRKLLGHVEDFS